tara:strand:+ start:346 stop:849 length:504 start_codon:yes stop_codon:yes gene_type:complete
MPGDTGRIFTEGHILSSLSDFRDGNAQTITTPALTDVTPVRYDANLLAEIVFGSFTNRQPQATAGVGAYTAPTMEATIQGAIGNPATEANWSNVASFGLIRPHVPSGTGAGTPANPIFSNRYQARFQHGVYTNWRVRATFTGSYPDFGNMQARLLAGGHRAREFFPA